MARAHRLLLFSGLGIPQVAIVAGPCTAGGAYTPTMSDEAIMVNKIGHVFLGGPPLVKAATGEVVTHEDLGGAKLHTSKSGVADFFANDEDESFAQVRDIISSLNLDLPQEIDLVQDLPLFDQAELDYFGGLSTISKTDMKSILARIVDYSRFSEFKAAFGYNLICGFAKICNEMVGICANTGRLSAEDGQKGAHFLQLCGGRNLPVIFLQNNNGEENHEFLSPESIKESAKFAHVSANLSVPKIALNVNGLGGDQDLVSMCGPSFGARFYLSWPRARYSKLELKPDTGNDAIESAQYAASRCTIDGVILPNQTRAALAKCLQISMHNHDKIRQRVNQQNSVVRI